MTPGVFQDHRVRACGVLMLWACATVGCAHARGVAPPAQSALPAVEVDSSGVPFAPAPEGLLRPGAVEVIQSRLEVRGLLQGSAPTTGRLDPPTRDALRRFQSKSDLPATGLPSYRTIEALNLKADSIFFDWHRQPVTPALKSVDEGSVGSRATAEHP